MPNNGELDPKRQKTSVELKKDHRDFDLGTEIKINPSNELLQSFFGLEAGKIYQISTQAQILKIDPKDPKSAHYELREILDQDGQPYPGMVVLKLGTHVILELQTMLPIWNGKEFIQLSEPHLRVIIEGGPRKSQMSDSFLLQRLQLSRAKIVTMTLVNAADEEIDGSMLSQLPNLSGGFADNPNFVIEVLYLGDANLSDRKLNSRGVGLFVQLAALKDKQKLEYLPAGTAAQASILLQQKFAERTGLDK